VKSVRYIEEAREEFLYEVEYFTKVSPLLGRRFDEAVQKAEALAAEFAEAGFPYRYGTRRVFPGKFRFSIVYLVQEDEIVIIAIAPFKRKPGYWRPRIGAASSAPRSQP
jgi:toxin ParE1/3/4